MEAAPEQERPGQGTVAGLGEFTVIDRITAGRRRSKHALLGPGDDAAVLLAPDDRVVTSTDVLVEDVHFRLDWSAPEHVGRKAVAVNLADIAAMGARPTGVLLGLACAGDTPVATVDELAAGIWAEAMSVGIGLVGGDVTAARQLVVSMTALGDLEGRAPVTRSGSAPGQVVAVCGRLGWAAAGLAVLGRGFRSPVAVVGAHRVPEPPYHAGPQAANAGATAMIDVSDGLLADLRHIAAASGVGIDLRSDLLAVPPRLTEVASALGADPMTWMLTGGEDHALVATFAAEEDVPPGWDLLGATVEAPSGAEAAASEAVTIDGVPPEVEGGQRGWQHFR